MINDLIILLRPKQWIKNLFIFLPLFFSGHFFNLNLLSNCVIVFISFCFVSSGIYCLNDIIDISSDKIHPTKKFRPIASDKIPIKNGYILMLSCFLIGFLFVIIFINFNVINILKIITLYICLSIAYCLFLKKISIIDVMVLSLGFVLRILIGGFSTNIALSNWIIIMTFLLALFLAIAKRRDDVIIFQETKLSVRKNINNYNISFLNQIITIIATIIFVSYIMYSISEEVINRFHTKYLYVTSIFVLLGIIRYMQVTLVYESSGNPTEILLKDKVIQLSILGWILLYSYIIYM